MKFSFNFFFRWQYVYLHRNLFLLKHFLWSRSVNMVYSKNVKMVVYSRKLKFIVYNENNKIMPNSCTVCLMSHLTLCLLMLSFSVFLLCSDIYKSNKILNNFQEFLTNVFLPLFEVTIDPNSHPELHRFLQFVSDFIFKYHESKY